MNKHNEGYRSGEHHWFMSLDHFSDGTEPEMSKCPPYFPPAKVEDGAIPEPVEIKVYVANDEEWEKYKSNFNKNYTPEEEPERYLASEIKLNSIFYLCIDNDLRRATWTQRVEEFNKHNEEYLKGEQSYHCEVNNYTDGTKSWETGCRPPPCLIGEFNVLSIEPIVVEEVPVHVANDEEWDKYKLKFNKVYESEEEPLK